VSDAADKAFDATPSRLERARREGDVARSAEVAAVVAASCAGIAALALVPLLAAAAQRAVTDAALGRSAIGPIAAVLGGALVVCAAGACGGVLAAGMQGGVQVRPLRSSFERLQPWNGLRRLWSRERAVAGVRAAIAVACAAVVVGEGVRGIVASSLAPAGPQALAAAAWSAALHAAGAVLAVGGLFAVVEFGAARAAWLRRLRMTFHELKRELKEQEGDPHARGRRRAMHRSFARGSLARVKDAAFVVVNPVHVAVALAYRPPAIAVPRVLVRASGDAALRARALAERHGIPVVEDPATARALYARVRAGEEIPGDFYVALAEIVAALLRTGELAG